jgi:hypothetical protein
MSDAAARIVRIVPEKNIAGMIVVGAELFEYRLDDRRVGATGQLTAFGVEECHPIIMLIADHRRTRGSFDRSLDLKLGGADRAVDDFKFDRTNGPA